MPSSPANTSSGTAPSRVPIRTHGRRSGRRLGQSRHELRGADAVTAASVPPIARVEVPALGKLAAADQPGVRAARLRAAAPARAAAEIHRRRPCTDVRRRDFLRAPRPGDGGCCVRVATRNRYASGCVAQLERDLELARMTASPKRVVGIALLGTFSITLLALVLGPAAGALRLTTLVHRTHGRGRRAGGRAWMHEQFPGSLQVLASALRAGYSFNGALGVVVDNVAEPARSELARVIQDDQLGVLPEEAIRRLGRRMANRDIEQVCSSPSCSGQATRRRSSTRSSARSASGRSPSGLTAHGPVDPDGAPGLSHSLSLARPPGRHGPLLHERCRTGGARGGRLDGGTGSILIQRIVDIDV